MRSTFLVTVDHAKPIPDLCDLIAQRAWNIDGVSINNAIKPGVTARVLQGNELARINAVIREEDADRDLKTKDVRVAGPGLAVDDERFAAAG